MDNDTKAFLMLFCGRQFNKDLVNLFNCLKQQDEDNKPILYESRYIKKIILPYEEYQKIKEQEKILTIIFEKKVDIEYIKTCFYDEKGGLKEYNSWVGHDEDKELTQEEYDSLYQCSKDLRKEK